MNSQPGDEYTTPVKITGIEMPFWDLVVLLVKLSLAAIPAGILLTAVVLTAWMMLAVLFVGAS